MKEKENTLLELKSEFSKVSGYKVNYTKINWIRNLHCSIIRNNLMKNVQGLYTETENIAERN